MTKVFIRRLEIVSYISISSLVCFWLMPYRTENAFYLLWKLTAEPQFQILIAVISIYIALFTFNENQRMERENTLEKIRIDRDESLLKMRLLSLRNILETLYSTHREIRKMSRLASKIKDNSFSLFYGENDEILEDESLVSDLTLIYKQYQNMQEMQSGMIDKFNSAFLDIALAIRGCDARDISKNITLFYEQNTNIRKFRKQAIAYINKCHDNAQWDDDSLLPYQEIIDSTEKT